MRRPFTQLYLHLVWSTWDHIPMLGPEIKPLVYASIQAECAKLKADVGAVGGTEDHVHLLTRIPTIITVAQLAKQVKGSTSHLVTHLEGTEQFLKWQGGYGAFSVSRSDVRRVKAYVLNQEQHHRDHTTERDLEVAWEEAVPSIEAP